MLSTITAADVQFRHEAAQRRREIEILTLIRERQALEQELNRIKPMDAGALRQPQGVTWPRPIHGAKSRTSPRHA
jgi:hypothetical protein